jgi:hypothetical protein
LSFRTHAEKAILKALPKMAKKATSKKLQTAFTKHESEAEDQVDRLDQVFELLGKLACTSPKGSAPCCGEVLHARGVRTAVSGFAGHTVRIYDDGLIIERQARR